MRAAGELSRTQAVLDQDRERDTAPRDFAVQKLVSAFRDFERGAQSITHPTRVSIVLTPTRDPR